jgi:hypothetical protein
VDMYCWKCGIRINGAGTFCESCGALVNRASLAAVGGTPKGNVLTMPATREFVASTQVVTLAEAQPPAPTAPRRPVWEIVVAIGVAVALLIGLVVWGVNDYGTHQKLRNTRAALALSTDQLRSTRDALSTANSTIAQQDGQIANLTAIRKRLLHQLGITRKQLAEAKGSLSHARSQILLQAGQITSLKTCLGGVNLALNDLWNYDYNGMASALGAVQGACNQSYAMF